MLDLLSTAEEIDSLVADGDMPRDHALRLIRNEARAHGCKARVVGLPTGDGKHVPDHVLVVSPDGEVRIFTNATDLAEWLGY